MAESDPSVPGKNQPAGGEQHKTGKRRSTLDKHQRGRSRKKRDREGEQADRFRSRPRRKPRGWKGPWPPKEMEK
jgi:hypothetical protein